VVVNTVPVESTTAPRRPQAPPLLALNVMTLCCGSSNSTDTTEAFAYVFAMKIVSLTRFSAQPLPA